MDVHSGELEVAGGRPEDFESEPGWLVAAHEAVARVVPQACSDAGRFGAVGGLPVLQRIEGPMPGLQGAGVCFEGLLEDLRARGDEAA